MIKIVVIKCLDGTAKEVSVRTQNSRREDERTTRYATFRMILSIFLLIWPILVMDRYTQPCVLATAAARSHLVHLGGYLNTLNLGFEFPSLLFFFLFIPALDLLFVLPSLQDLDIKLRAIIDLEL